MDMRDLEYMEAIEDEANGHIEAAEKYRKHGTAKNDRAVYEVLLAIFEQNKVIIELLRTK